MPRSEAPRDRASTLRRRPARRRLDRHAPSRGAANGRFMRVVHVRSARRTTSGLPADRFLDREISLAAVQRAGAPARRRRERPAARAGPLPRDLHVATSTSSSWSGSPASSAASPPASPSARRPAWSRARCSSRSRSSPTSCRRCRPRVYKDKVRPALEDEGITIVRWDELERRRARAPAAELFADRVFPVLTPLAVDPAHPFPYISGLSLNLAVVLVNPKTGKEHFARVKVPPLLPRLLHIEPEPGEPAT